MLLFYVDESGHHKIADGSSEWFVLAGVGVRDTTRQPLAKALSELKARHFGAAAGSWNDGELKGRSLANLTRKLSGESVEIPAGYGRIDSLQKLGVLRHDLCALFASFRPVVFGVAISKSALTDPAASGALGPAYALLYRRIALAMERIFQGECAVIVADQQVEHERFYRSGEMLEFRDRLQKATGRRPNYELLLDTPMWIDSKLSSWDREIIQLADLVAFETHELVKTGKPHDTRLWAAIDRCLAADGRSGESRGEGLVIFPRPEVWPTGT